MLRLAIAPTIPHIRLPFDHSSSPALQPGIDTCFTRRGQFPCRGVLGERGSGAECRARPTRTGATSWVSEL